MVKQRRQTKRGWQMEGIQERREANNIKVVGKSLKGSYYFIFT